MLIHHIYSNDFPEFIAMAIAIAKNLNMDIDTVTSVLINNQFHYLWIKFSSSTKITQFRKFLFFPEFILWI